MPLLSVIIPTFNSEKTFIRCLESLASQTYRDFEVIVMDGLSTDSTVSIAESFRARLPILVVRSEKDAGVYDAMNKGISLAKGEWIYFLGSDDELFDQNVLSNLFVNSAEIINNNDFVYGNVNSTHLGNGYDGEFTITKIFFKNICHQAIFYRKSVFVELGSYDLNYPIWADWEFNIKCFGQVNIRAKWLDIVVANYFEGGISQKSKDLIFESNTYLIFESSLPIAEKKSIFRMLIEEHYSLAEYRKIEPLYRELEVAYRDLEVGYRDLEVGYRDLEVRSQGLEMQNKGLQQEILAMRSTIIWKFRTFFKNLSNI